ncbi:MAG: ankyrin repeat domain-containing protein [Proteobacteria bacterium]|nr:ankyrin repeat domain-containing protein [Pseudomonadota bacterium]
MTHYDIESMYRRHPGDGVTPDQIHDAYRQIVAENMEEAKQAAFTAAEYADVVALKILFDGGVPPTATDDYDFTLLHHIARKGDPKFYEEHLDAFNEMMAMLLDARVSVLKKDKNENLCCYHYAARAGFWRFVKVLRERGAKLDMIGKNGATALHELAEWFYINRYSTYAPKNEGDEKQIDDFIKTAREFIDAGLDLGAKDDYGNTPGDIVISKRAAKLFDMLVPDKNVFQAIYINAYDAIANLALKGPNAICETDTYGLRDFNGLTPLGAGCREIDDRAVDILLDAGLDPNYVSDSGRGAIIEMFKSDNWNETALKENKIGKILAAFALKGWDKNGAADEDGNTLLGFAVKSNFSRRVNNQSLEGIIIDYLIANGADINAANRMGQTPLMFACAGDYDRMESVQLALCEAGADVTARDSNGKTALHYAAANRKDTGARALADMLFSFGKPDASAADNAGKTALDIATENGNEETVKYLLGKM